MPRLRQRSGSFMRPIIKSFILLLIRAAPLDAAGTCARKLKIQATSGKPINVFEVQAFSANVNKALNKVANQSSDLSENFVASKAVDGNTNSFSHTALDDSSAWWEAQLFILPLESSKEAGEGSKSIIRRYEFYEYTGDVNAEDNEAQPACESDPESCDSVGNYLGAQMAAAVIGLGDSLNIATQSPVMAGRQDVAYFLMLTAVGGTSPYTWSLNSGTLFDGLDLSSDGFLMGIPTESGQRALEFKVVDAESNSVLKFLNLTIASTDSPTPSPSKSSTQSPVSTSPSMSLDPPTKAPSNGSTQSPVSTSPTLSSTTKGPTKSPTGPLVTFGALSNFDTYCVVPKSSNGEYEECHGFEIELEGLPCSNVYYTFSFNRYGTPSKRDTQTGGCIVSYESAYDDVGDQWLVTTPIPSSLLQGGRVTPTGGHSCFSSGQSDYATSGCEHFGVSLGGASGPTATKYRWLIAHPDQPKTLMTSTTRVGIPAVTWSVNAGAGAGGGNVVAAVIAAEPQDEEVLCACAKWGEPKWVKIFVTEIEYECDLDHLLTDSNEVPQSKNETEMEWVLLQARPTCNDDCSPNGLNETENELESSKEAGEGSKSIIRRYEFYEYTGDVNAEDNEAQPACESDPESCDSVGNYLGAQMAAAVIGLGDSLNIATQSPVMAGRQDVAYFLMLTAVGGTSPYTWSLNSGTLFDGLDLSSDGFLMGIPTESGQRALEFKVVDADSTSVLKFLNLTIASTDSPTRSPSTISTPLPTFFISTEEPSFKPTSFDDDSFSYHYDDDDEFSYHYDDDDESFSYV
ncbi:hypothetical protein HJC23_001703 [Cyclotella cryptica]|uniref:Uncharacterized protein n=1 Tax=Cyclotella cryptica TaxID=29204 RepID=A0ABD3QLV8_9STRA